MDMLLPVTLPLTLTATEEKMVMGVDVSRFQGRIDYAKAYQAGVRFAAMRATVGDYYADATFEANWCGFAGVGILPAAYHVVAPEVSARTQTEWMKQALAKFAITPCLPLVLDCELARGQTQARITAVIQECVLRLADLYGRMPWIYTRQTWWDYWVLPWTRWHECGLWAARYALYLSGPWSDGECRFRDWDAWRVWQATSTASGADYGAESADIDLDYFNGTLAELLSLAGQTAPAPPPVPVGTEIPAGRAGLLATAINVRRSPRVAPDNVAGSLKGAGAQLYFYERYQDADGLWLRVAPKEKPLWIAASYRGQTLVKIL